MPKIKPWELPGDGKKISLGEDATGPYIEVSWPPPPPPEGEPQPPPPVRIHPKKPPRRTNTDPVPGRKYIFEGDAEHLKIEVEILEDCRIRFTYYIRIKGKWVQYASVIRGTQAEQRERKKDLEKALIDFCNELLRRIPPERKVRLHARLTAPGTVTAELTYPEPVLQFTHEVEADDAVDFPREADGDEQRPSPEQRTR